ncbi:IS3 family transposase [uncultured Sunxiuqinia sp.]|uniref:IS3 family transposase n=1 Tax=uncultured Sunxiuqinia sp. TaxID=1573825 RepID=UPI003747F04C
MFWDNAVAESFFYTLKSELVDGNKFESIEGAKSKVFEWAEIWYNKKDCIIYWSKRLLMR